MSETLFYRCELCGNIVAVINSGGGELSCCGQVMTKLQANATDGAKEKHVPVLTYKDGKVEVNVGSVAHPMTEEHYIEWIAFVSDKKIEIVKLIPGREPKAEFFYRQGEDEVIFVGENDEFVPNCEANPCNFAYSKKSSNVAAYAYCNLHGLWKAEL